MASKALTRVRKICLAFPDAYEKEAWQAPTFRAGDRMFATFVENHHGDGRTAVWCIAPPDVQRPAVQDDPENIFIPPYVGSKGWIGIRLDRGISWKVVSAHLEQAYRWIAPRRRIEALPVKLLQSRRESPHLPGPPLRRGR